MATSSRSAVEVKNGHQTQLMTIRSELAALKVEMSLLHNSSEHLALPLLRRNVEQVEARLAILLEKMHNLESTPRK